jgi:hypothetical protein
MQRPRDWFLLAIGAAFVLCGAIILPSDPDSGIITIAFFGSCAIVPGASILRDLRSRPAPDRVTIAGGIPIRPSRLFLGGIAAWVIVVTSICLTFGGTYPLVFRVLVASVLLAGCLMFVAVTLGWLPGTFLQFDPNGITFGYRRYSFVIGFDNIAAISITEIQRNTFLLLQLHNPDLIETAPPESRLPVFKKMHRLDSVYGAHIMIPTGHYRMDPSLLAQALHRYVTEPSSRSELAPTARIGHATPNANRRPS